MFPALEKFLDVNKRLLTTFNLALDILRDDDVSAACPDDVEKKWIWAVSYSEQSTVQNLKEVHGAVQQTMDAVRSVYFCLMGIERDTLAEIKRRERDLAAGKPFIKMGDYGKTLTKITKEESADSLKAFADGLSAEQREKLMEQLRLGS